MSNKPIFVATHPRACSTAFERVFMTRRDSLQCIHEPFGDAFYYGPERLSSRFEDDEQTRISSGFSNSTYKTILERFNRESAEGKRLFIKDMAYYLLPEDEKPVSIAPSLARIKRGVGTSEPSINGVDGDHKAPYPYHTETEANNPTVIPEEILKQFHFTFLIRHPRSAVPSYYRCMIPPLDKVTGFYQYMPSEAGYAELRRLFDYLRSTGQVGPRVAEQGSHGGVVDSQQLPSQEVNGAQAISAGRTTSGRPPQVDICVVDADNLLDNPAETIEAFCKSVGLNYDPQMLNWDSKEDHKQAREAFEKWKGFHDDATDSSGLKPRSCKKQVKAVEEEDREWTDKFGEARAKLIRETVNASVEDYEYLKQFALKV